MKDAEAKTEERMPSEEEMRTNAAGSLLVRAKVLGLLNELMKEGAHPGMITAGVSLAGAAVAVVFGWDEEEFKKSVAAAWASEKTLMTQRQGEKQ